MDRNISALVGSRRSTAIGIWSLLLIMPALVPSVPSDLVAVVSVLAVSMASGIALLLIVSPSGDDQVSSGQRNAAVAISFAIPLAWSFLLFVRNRPSISLLITIVAVLPILVMRLALMLRASAVVPASPEANSKAQSPPPLNTIDPATNCSDELEDRNPAIENPDLELQPMMAIPFGQPSIEQEEPIPAHVTQWLTRSLTTDGEIIEGGIRIEFADRQRDATVHVSFCPPMSGVPEVTAEDLDGCDLEVRVSAAFPFGARITVRRTSNAISDGKRLPAEACRIGFVAVASAVRRVA